MQVLSLVTNRYASFYRKQERGLERHGIDLTHCYPAQQSGAHAEQNEITRSWTDYLRLYSEVLSESLGDYDVVHANYGLTAPFAVAQPTRPIVLSLWGSDLSGKVGQLSKLCTKYCDEVIVMSDTMRNELGRNAHVIPHGIDVEQFSPMPQSDAQETVGWDPENLHVLFPYDPSRRVKNYPLAERVAETAQSDLSKTVVLQTVYEVAHEKMSLYMNAADALLLTSLREGFPNSVKEAIACNLPVVSTDVGGVCERLDRIDNSYVGTSENELVSALVDVLRSEQRSDGREYIDDLSVDAVATSIIEVYEKAIVDS